MYNETVLIKLARRFDVQALTEIYDIYSPRLYRYAMRLLGDQDLAEECVAETFERFLQAMKRGGGPDQYLQAYLYRVAHNWITDHYRRQPAFLPLEAMSGNPVGEQLDNDLILEQDRTVVRTALTMLTPEQCQVVVLKYLDNLDNQAIARVVNKPVGAVKALQHRALNTLRRIIKKDFV